MYFQRNMSSLLKRACFETASSCFGLESRLPSRRHSCSARRVVCSTCFHLLSLRGRFPGHLKCICLLLLVTCFVKAIHTSYTLASKGFVIIKWINARKLLQKDKSYTGIMPRPHIEAPRSFNPHNTMSHDLFGKFWLKDDSLIRLVLTSKFYILYVVKGILRNHGSDKVINKYHIMHAQTFCLGLLTAPCVLSDLHTWAIQNIKVLK